MSEMETTQATESTQGMETEVQSTGSADASTGGSESIGTETAALSSGTGTGEQPAPAAYTPNFKFKSYDKEAEFDEFLRPVVKDKDTEEKLRDLYTKAFGLEPMKQKYNKLQEEHVPLKQRFENLYGNVNRLGKFLEGGDFDNFFQGLNVPEEKVFQWALRRAQMHEMSPEQRQAYEELTARRRNETLLSEQFRSTQAQLEELKSQQRFFELDQTLSRPEISQIAQAFESKLGPGSFKNEVIARARQAFKDSGKDLSPMEAVNMVIEHYKPFLAAQASANVGAVTKSQSQAPVIPNVTGRSTSPAAKQVKSLDDIRKLAKDLD